MSRKTKRAIAKKLDKAAKEKQVPPLDPRIESINAVIGTNPKGLWDKIIRAAGAEPRDAESIRGVSGINHQAAAIGVDDDRRRLILISAEHDARAAALAQADIQSSLPSLKVIVARPVALDLSTSSRALTSALGRSIIGMEDLKNQAILETALRPSMERLGLAFALSASSALGHVLEAVQQLAKLKFVKADENTDSSERDDGNPMILNLEALNEWDPMELDRRYGVCPIPLYEFEPEEIEAALVSKGIEEVRDLLQKHNVLQYFFPAPDQLALGVIERGNVASASQLVEQMTQVPQMGHPFGQQEIAPSQTALTEIVDALRDRNLVVEGEVTLELTQEGKSVRQIIRYKPREGLLSKLLNRFEVKLDLKDIFRG